MSGNSMEFFTNFTKSNNELMRIFVPAVLLDCGQGHLFALAGWLPLTPARNLCRRLDLLPLGGWGLRHASLMSTLLLYERKIRKFHSFSTQNQNFYQLLLAVCCSLPSVNCRGHAAAASRGIFGLAGAWGEVGVGVGHHWLCHG